MRIVGVLVAAAFLGAVGGCGNSASITVRNELDVPIKVRAQFGMDKPTNPPRDTRSWLIEPGSAASDSIPHHGEPPEGRLFSQGEPQDAVLEVTPMAVINGVMAPSTVILYAPGPFRLRVRGKPESMVMERLDDGDKRVIEPRVKVLIGPIPR